MQQNGVSLSSHQPDPSIRMSLPTGTKTMAVQRQKNPGKSIGMLVLFSETMPMTTCAENTQESEMPIMMTDHTETLTRVEGVRVASICRTRSNRTRSWDAEANEASGLDELGLDHVDKKLTVDRLAPKIVQTETSSAFYSESPPTLICYGHASEPSTLPILWWPR